MPNDANATGSARRVLIIEDQADTQRLLTILLQASKRYTVETAATGGDGVQKAVAAPPDLILLDFSLPDMDGPAVLDTLRRDGVKSPVIFLTAVSEPAQLEACKRADALAIISKPVSPLNFVKQLESHSPPP